MFIAINPATSQPTNLVAPYSLLLGRVEIRSDYMKGHKTIRLILRDKRTRSSVAVLVPLLLSVVGWRPLVSQRGGASCCRKHVSVWKSSSCQQSEIIRSWRDDERTLRRYITSALEFWPFSVLNSCFGFTSGTEQLDLWSSEDWKVFCVLLGVCCPLVVTVSSCNTNDRIIDLINTDVSCWQLGEDADVLTGDLQFLITRNRRKINSSVNKLTH